uniref:Polyhomeotic homolog 3 n=1 Tax=Aotus nancymaae TaxID=37293 RepID=A0A2K5CXU2_AOTNA
MDSEPNPGTSSVSTTTSSTTTTTITTSSSRMQQPQISVYSGSDRHAVQELYSLGYET